jgi:plasmid maintenance system antidote protein VapI
MDGIIQPTRFSTQDFSHHSIPGNWHDVLDEMLAMPGYSKQRVAKEIGVSVATIRRLQQNTVRIPSQKTIQKLLSLYCLIRTQASEQQQH